MGAVRKLLLRKVTSQKLILYLYPASYEPYDRNVVEQAPTWKTYVHLAFENIPRCVQTFFLHYYQRNYEQHRSSYVVQKCWILCKVIHLSPLPKLLLLQRMKQCNNYDGPAFSLLYLGRISHLYLAKRARETLETQLTSRGPFRYCTYQVSDAMMLLWWHSNSTAMAAISWQYSNDSFPTRAFQ